jgi:hypothetical protein
MTHSRNRPSSTAFVRIEPVELLLAPDREGPGYRDDLPSLALRISDGRGGRGGFLRPHAKTECPPLPTENRISDDHLHPTTHRPTASAASPSFTTILPVSYLVKLKVSADRRGGLGAHDMFCSARGAGDMVRAVPRPPSPRSADHEWRGRVRDQDDQQASEGHRVVLVAGRGRGDPPTACRSPERDRHHEPLLGGTRDE